MIRTHRRRIARPATTVALKPVIFSSPPFPPFSLLPCFLTHQVRHSSPRSSLSRFTYLSSCESDFEDDDEYNKPRTVPSYTHRITLGLPPKGPLDINEVKTAFRASALKWHPDKHQGPSQVRNSKVVLKYTRPCALL